MAHDMGYTCWGMPDLEIRHRYLDLVAKRSSLLYVTPVRPALTGNGLAMRAGIVLEALARATTASACTSSRCTRASATSRAELAALCEEVVEAPTHQPGSQGPALRCRARVPSGGAPVRARGGPEQPARRPRRGRDADAPAAGRALPADGRRGAGLGDGAEAARYEPLEEEVSESWDRVYVCSAADRDELARRGAGGVRVLPERVGRPADAAPRGRPEPFTLPLRRQPRLLPERGRRPTGLRRGRAAVRRPTPAPFGHRGRRLGPDSASSAPGVELRGRGPRRRPLVPEAGAAVVPIRAGGGTRIKILEAFAHGVRSSALRSERRARRARTGRTCCWPRTRPASPRRCAELMESPALADAAQGSGAPAGRRVVLARRSRGSRRPLRGSDRAEHLQQAARRPRPSRTPRGSGRAASASAAPPRGRSTRTISTAWPRPAPTSSRRWKST